MQRMAAGADIAFPAIPYGRAYFKGIRLEGCLYVDKTRFIRELEDERYVFFIRPRRFGKTCWLSRWRATTTAARPRISTPCSPMRSKGEAAMPCTFTLDFWIDDGWYVGKLREVPNVFRARVSKNSRRTSKMPIRS